LLAVVVRLLARVVLAVIKQHRVSQLHPVFL
jgi:hypothetical protein